ncbi:hypothetical protein [Dyadobacter sp. CY312]|uniref:hypothetical protein n=1 Tax=Dyadobacter sp. CY312 TaxID=2907303 RepID=UPI001F1BB04A|nr:hypothetical protein [Dyadobacter sp. CY312]MCE7043741.1 hypothetical protein [Dyadobacter sp. CY312]
MEANQDFLFYKVDRFYFRISFLATFSGFAARYKLTQVDRVGTLGINQFCIDAKKQYQA